MTNIQPIRNVVWTSCVCWVCPFKKVNTRRKVTPWLTPEIYRAIREKNRLIKIYKVTRDPELLRAARVQRNRVNSLIERAKTEFILSSLHMNAKKPKQFWKVINDLIDDQDCVDITSYVFRDVETGIPVLKEEIPNYLNTFFVNIAERTRNRPLNVHMDHVDYYPDIETFCDFEPPALEDIYSYMMEIDVNTSSCLRGIHSKMCKSMIDKIPDKFRHIFANSLFSGIFPHAWTCAQVTLIPKNGDKELPGNWRPISQTIVFAKILEKIVHKQLLNYFMVNNILTDSQYGFLPGRSIQEAVFNTVSNMYSCIYEPE